MACGDMLLIDSRVEVATWWHVEMCYSSTVEWRWPPGGMWRYVTHLKSQVSSGLLQTAQTWANAGVCGGLCVCAVGGTFD